MKAILFLFYFCLLHFITFGQNIKKDTSKYLTDHYRERIIVFKKEPILKNKIIFLGNSITEFADWQKLLNDSSVINRGIAGDNTYGVLDRLSDIIGRQPSKLFIEIGINDFSLNVLSSVTIKNILSIVSKVHNGSPHTVIFVLSVLPTNDNVKNDYPFALNKSKQIDFINDRLLKSARVNHYTYIDLGYRLKDKNGKLDIKFAKPDGIHLNEEGYQLWVKFLRAKKYI